MKSERLSPVLSIVAPAYNEERNLPLLHARVAQVMDNLGERWELILVNDGSRDGTLEVMMDLRARDPRVAIVNLSRNFGKEIATTAGLDHAHGDAVIVVDADLQDPPEVIPELVAAWQRGFDTVYAQRRQRQGETWLKRATAAAFYRLLGQATSVPIPRDTGDFRLMSRRVVSALAEVRERHRFMKGLFAWVGFSAAPWPTTASRGIPDRRPGTIGDSGISQSRALPASPRSRCGSRRIWGCSSDWPLRSLFCNCWCER